MIPGLDRQLEPLQKDNSEPQDEIALPPGKPDFTELIETPPPVLYRYMDVEGAVKTLASRTNKFSLLRDLDDFREGLIGNIEDGNPKEEHELLQETLLSDSKSRELYNARFGTKYSIQEWTEGLRADSIDIDCMIKDGMTKVPDSILVDLQKEWGNQYAVCCFSEKPDIEQMWAKYADRSFGFCLGFHIPPQKELIKVDYSDVPFSFPYPLGRRSNETYRKAYKALSTKLKCWEYQKEWRVLLPLSRLQNKNGILLAPYHQSTLQSIIMGPRCKAKPNLFARILGGLFPSTSIYKAVIKPTSPEMSFVEFSRPKRSQSGFEISRLLKSELEMGRKSFQISGFDSTEIRKQLALSTVQIKQRLEAYGARSGLPILAQCNSTESENAIRSIAFILESTSRLCAAVFESPIQRRSKDDIFEERSALFFNQGLEEMLSAFNPNISNTSDNQLVSQLLSHAALYARPIIESWND